LNKKILFIFFLFLLVFAGFIAVTQEMDFFQQNPDAGKEYFVTPPKWFKSNSGGMALEETYSKTAALRNEYVLLIETPGINEIPNQLLMFFEDNFIAELRTLFKNAEEQRRQWLFKDKNGITRLNAALPDKQVNRNGFIEIYGSNSDLITEYRFFNNQKSSKIEYTYYNNLLLNCAYLINENDIHDSEYVIEYIDLYRYNRSMSLRAVERVYHSDLQIAYDDSLRLEFPRNVMQAAGSFGFIAERINLYSPFFGDIYSESNYKMIYETDERGRVLSQTYFNEYDEIIWIIQNVWLDNRIVSSKKTEGDTVLLAEYEYNQNGERTTERNYKNGHLERIVRAEGNFDIEELYINSILVLRAVWEDGKKISETRIR